MKYEHLKIPAFMSVVLLMITPPSAFSQGSLTPPGAPGETMRTLQQIEPRTPITNLPYTITQPGSYYLTANLSSTTNGIIIQTNQVTLDLMGFSITGDRGITDHGIWLTGTSSTMLRDVVVRGGMVKGFGYGVHSYCAQNNRLESLTISSNSIYGIYFDAYSGPCNGNSVRNCTVTGNGNSGIYISTSSAGECNGNIIADSVINDNSTGVLFFGQGAAKSVNGNLIADCAISDNRSYGVCLLGGYSGECSGNRVADCTINGNNSGGVCAYTVVNGKCTGNAVVNCTISGNGNNGIRIVDGASQNRIENNHISGTTGSSSYGIYTSGSHANLILQNTCTGQTNNFSISTNDTYGPIVSNSGELATSGGSAHPWANFSR